MKKSINLLLLVFSLLISSILAGCSSSNEKSYYSGTIEGNDIPVLTELSGTVDGVFVEEGDVVHQGQVLAQIDDRMLRAQYDESQAAVKVAEVSLAEAKAGTRNQEIMKTLAMIDQNDAKIYNVKIQLSKLTDKLFQVQTQMNKIDVQLQSAVETMNYFQDHLVKIEQLYDSGAVSEQDVRFQKEQLNKVTATVNQLQQQKSELASVYEMSKKDEDSYETQIKELNANKKIQQSQLSLQEEGVTEFTVSKLYSQLEQAKAKLEQIEIQKEKTKVVSNVDGIVIRRNVSKGEVVAPNFQILTLLEENKRKVKVYIPEVNLNQINLGKEVKITVDAYPGKLFKGIITYIANEAEFTPKNVQTFDERTKMVFEVVIKVVEDQGQLNPGMPADVYFVDVKG